MNRRVLCRLTEIPDPGSKGFDFRDGDDLHSVFVVRAGATLRAYENSCPHTSGPSTGCRTSSSPARRT